MGVVPCVFLAFLFVTATSFSSACMHACECVCHLKIPGIQQYSSLTLLQLLEHGIKESGVISAACAFFSTLLCCRATLSMSHRAPSLLCCGSQRSRTSTSPPVIATNGALRCVCVCAILNTAVVWTISTHTYLLYTNTRAKYTAACQKQCDSS